LISFFLMEHLVFVLIILIRLGLASTTKWVNLFLARRDHKVKSNRWKSLIERANTKRSFLANTISENKNK
jgi:hypothetical protein